ncbi:MAG: ATP-grasp domain-containing protein [Chitinophagaceae bacterium]|nr:ATP-grasp domain-containing protein [Chitinophagaceae bacterium]
MNICVLLPDYTTSNVDYQNYDPPRNLSGLLPDDKVDTVFLNKLTTYKQLKALSHQQYDVFVNLCEAYLEWEVPGIDVIYSLELLNLPFTGPNSILYDPSKEIMKLVAFYESVKTPAYCLVNADSSLNEVTAGLQFPLFVKPAKAGDSLGIDANSLVYDMHSLQQKVTAIIAEYDELLVEEYIEGREFTVLVAANADGKTVTAFQPVEFVFPKGNAFKTYALKTSELHTDANILVEDPVLSEQLKNASKKIFHSFGGVGYARLDFRANNKGELYFLEINFTCSVFYNNGYEGSADYILKYDGIGQAGFLKHIIQEAIARYSKNRKCYQVRNNAISGFGIYAIKKLMPFELIFKGEEMSQRIVTKKWVEENWNEAEKLNFRKYAYPLGKEVFLLWSKLPQDWAPQNHSCNANTAFVGLNVVATRAIEVNEELTLDYAQFLDENAEPFECLCGAANCRGTIRGLKGNSFE